LFNTIKYPHAQTPLHPGPSFPLFSILPGLLLDPCDANRFGSDPVPYDSTCALADGSKIIMSRDKHLLKVSGWQGIQVLKPREFVDLYLG